MYKETPEAILSVNFGLFGQNVFTGFIQPEIKRQILEEVCEVGHKNLPKNFRVEQILSTRNVSRYFPV